MDNEIGNSIHITINLIVISVVIAIILMFANMGQSFGRESVDRVADMQAEIYASDLIQSANHGSMPAATVYLLLQRNEHVIRSIGGTVYNQTIAEADDLLPILDKKVMMTVSDDNGIFDVEIWEDCSCKNPTTPST